MASVVTPTTPASMSAMNSVEAIRSYIFKMIREPKGAKVLLLDDVTKKVVSVVCGLSELMRDEVFLVDMLANPLRQNLGDPSCIIFVRPTRDNVSLIMEELQDSKYREYRIYFSNFMSTENLDSIASVDRKQLVQSVFEYYADFIAVDSNCFHVDVGSYIPLVNRFYDHQSFDRMIDGMLSVLLSMKKKPIIRYQKSSEVCKKLADNLTMRMERERGLFDFRSNPVLLVVDRRDDPITPLLTQWTYQAMIHEILGIRDNLVEVKDDSKKGNDDDEIAIDMDELTSGKSSGKSDKKQLVVSATTDDFFNRNMYQNWGDLVSNIATLAEDYKKKANVKGNVSSFEDIHRFMSEFPQFKKLAGEMEKHFTIVQELKSAITNRRLMDLSELEQDMVCSANHANHQRDLFTKLNDDRISKEDAIRLVLLYALRYENQPGNVLPQLMGKLNDNKGVTSEELSIVKAILKFAGNNVRTPGLFDSDQPSVQGFFQRLANKSGLQLQETSVFTQHKPLLSRIIDNIFKGKLNDQYYPYHSSAASREIPKEVIVFFVGGITYEETLAVYNFNQKQENKGKRSVLLGGTTVINSSDWLREIKQFYSQGDSSVELV